MTMVIILWRNLLELGWADGNSSLTMQNPLQVSFTIVANASIHPTIILITGIASVFVL